VTVGEALLRLPRGRVTHPDKVYLILHGDDSPIPDWSEALMGGFSLQGRRVKSLLDDHEQTFHGDDKVMTRPSHGYAQPLLRDGDIHGCYTALKTLIEAIDPRPEETVVVLGVVIDSGPDSRDCVQLPGGIQIGEPGWWSVRRESR
jgi:hypothetical protein